MVVGAYISALRYSTLYNETSGSIALFLEFLGYPKEQHNRGKQGNIERLRNALTKLAEYNILDCTKTSVQKLSGTTPFLIPFGPSAGWRMPKRSTDAKFTWSEVSYASKRIRAIEMPSGTDLAMALQFTAYLRSQMAMRFCTYGADGTAYDHTGVFNLDAITEFMHWGKERVLDMLTAMRKLHLCSFRTLTFKLPTMSHESPESSKLRYLLFAQHGHGGTAKLTARARDLKDLHKDGECIHDSADPNERRVMA